VFALYPDYLEKCGILLPAGALDPVSQFSQFGNQQVPVLPLDFNRPVFNSTARAAALLEFQGESFQFISRQRNTRNKGNTLPIIGRYSERQKEMRAELYSIDGALQFLVHLSRRLFKS
jgi:hypothetical protein